MPTGIGNYDYEPWDGCPFKKRDTGAWDQAECLKGFDPSGNERIQIVIKKGRPCGTPFCVILASYRLVACPEQGAAIGIFHTKEDQIVKGLHGSH